MERKERSQMVQEINESLAAKLGYVLPEKIFRLVKHEKFDYKQKLSLGKLNPFAV